SKRKGATDAEVVASLDTGFTVNVRMGEIETVEFNRDKGFGITVYFGQRKGSASTSDTSEQAITATIEAACDIAKLTGEDQYAGLADAALMATSSADLDLDLYHPWDIDPEAAIALATKCEKLGLDYDKRITNSEGVSLSTY